MTFIYVVSASLLAASILYAAKRFRMERPRVGQRPTIEQEQEQTRAVAAHGQHWGNLSDDGQDHTDPLYHVADLARSVNRTM